MPLNPNVDGSITATVTPDPARVDLTKAFDAIRNKRRDLDTLFSYYDGPQPLKYSTERLTDTFQNIKTHFDVNWCAVIIDAALDRIQLNGFTTKDNDQQANDVFKIIFDRLHLDIEADKAHQASLTTSQAYVIVWKVDGETVAYYNDPRMCHVFYDDANPRLKRYAAKWFKRAGGGQEITLYYVDRIEHWTTPKQKTDTMIDRDSSFNLESIEPNAFGVIPVFDLKSPGEIFKVVTLQDAENKLFADMMVAAEFGAYVQRYVISNSDPGALKNAPNEIWWIPSGDGVGQQSQVGQFSTTDLGNYLNAMDKIASNMAIISRTPKHYFMTTGADLSGEALLAMEAPLVKKCQKRQNLFASQWQDIAAFIAQLEGMTVTPDDVMCLWERPESIQPLTEMQVIQTAVNMGVPLEVMLKRNGWTEEEIADVTKAKQAALNKRINSVRVPVDTLPNGGSNAGQNPAG
jgi:hypothetical protein